MVKRHGAACVQSSGIRARPRRPPAHAVVPLDQVAAAHRAVAKGGVRRRYVLQP
jgi:hypothetical protein